MLAVDDGEGAPAPLYHFMYNIDGSSCLQITEQNR